VKVLIYNFMKTLGWCKGGRKVKGEMNSGESAGSKWEVVIE
jgi:hypothetical protein